MTEKVNHPAHYNHLGDSGINKGNAIKYIWRAGLKNDDEVEDLKKALWYIQREIDRMTRIDSESK